jgi:hypothetical protein
MRRAQHMAKGHAGSAYIGDVFALAAQQPRVFLALHRLADPELSHALSPFPGQ